MSGRSGSGGGPGGKIDYESVFLAFPVPVLLLTPDLVIADANDMFLRTFGLDRAGLRGMRAVEAFPVEPDNDVDRMSASAQRAVDTREQDVIGPVRYDAARRDPGDDGVRYWSPVHIPVVGPDGEVSMVIARLDDVTALVRAGRGVEAEGARLSSDVLATAGLLVRAQELEELNERLREAHARERAIAVTLQRAMLPTVVHDQYDFAAVRYRPATGSLNVCGDWYDLTRLERDRLAVAVGDVVGHGLEAAGVMGQLRSALSAAVRAFGQPGPALKTLARYAITVEGALATTAVQTVIDRARGTITYSRAGHPPPALLDAGSDHAVFLDEIADPPLGAWTYEANRSQATVGYSPGAILVLYTDGLVERRGEDIDVGLRRLTDSIARHRRLGPEDLADALLHDLRAEDGTDTDDDVALVTLRL